MKKTLLLIAGHLCLVLGVIGAVLPVLPTTPFLLLAAFCYSKSSNKLHLWILNQKHLGPPLRDWEKNGVIGLKAKLVATIMLSLVIVFRIPYLKVTLALRITGTVILILVLVFIWSRPSSMK
ncbi:MAG: YbaN family protein [Bacteriovorax sp.]|nr:YbaN family protein [Bacteriovorax sp.]